MNITEFLEARIAEDEAEARNLQKEDDFGLEAFGNYMLAECAAKRAIRELHPRVIWMQVWDILEYGCGTCSRNERDGYPCPTLQALADVYADHPDYQEEWA